jgi:Uma2 family endonuclease
VRKDRQRLRTAYHAAGVPEYWLIDARGEQVFFEINIRYASEYQPAAVDATGFQRSTVLACGYLLQRTRDQLGYWQYTVKTQV